MTKLKTDFYVYVALSMMNMKSRLLKLDDLLDRLTDIIEAEGTQRAPSVSCEGEPINKKRHSSPFEMHLDFYINATGRVSESLEKKYMRSKSNNARDENYRSTY